MAARERRARRATDASRVVGAGDRIDGYRVGELLHEGGMSRLYRVTHPRHRLPMVIKVPKLGRHAKLSAFSAFENELRILERLKGPHVPRLIAAGNLVQSPYLVIEFIAGDALAQAAQRAPLAVAELCQLGRRLCKAVHELHRQNVIHLDLNPSNVRNRGDGEMVLIDFGLAHHAALPDMIDAAFGEQEGTTPYISPEQVRHVRHDSRSDIFAVGAILYRFATGHYPFGPPNIFSAKKRLFQTPPPPRAYNDELPAWLQEVILRCLETHPKNRYTSARQVGYLLAHPDAVPVGRRGSRQRPSALRRAASWVKSLYTVFDDLAPARPYERVAAAPHVLIALDLEQSSAALREVLRNTVRKFSAAEPGSYFTCLTVVPRAELRAADGEPDARAAMRHVSALHHWAQPLALPPDRIYFQVLPGETAATIVEYARNHVIDYIIMGARASSKSDRFLGSVASRVAAEAPCTVTVVRSRRDASSA